MKRNVKKIVLNRETLRNLDDRQIVQVLGGDPPTIGASCHYQCPVEPFTRTMCA